MESILNSLSDKDFVKIKKIVLNHAGLVLKDDKKDKIFSKLKNRMKKLNIFDLNVYCRYLIANRAELEEFVNLLTNLSTYFFRENHHFIYLAQHILPELLSQKNRIRIWSAGCATGEEAYSIAITVYENVQHIENYDIKILATDISSMGLAVAKEGRYRANDLKMFSSERRQNVFTLIQYQNIEYLQIKNSIKKLIYFNHLNLFEFWPMKGLFDVIFCRNIFIYFSKEKAEFLLNRLDKQLAPGGFLIVGHAESSFIYKLKYLRVAETIYKKPISGNIV